MQAAGYTRCDLLISAALVVLSLTVSISAQQHYVVQPTSQHQLRVDSDDTTVPHGHHYVVAIGVDHYQNWPVLNNAVNDATGFAKLLIGSFGFEYAAEPLIEEHATRDHINSLIDELRTRLRPEDDLIIFFAGHGTTRKEAVGHRTRSVGFIVPAEARGPSGGEQWRDYIVIDQFLEKISTLPSSHILVILDSCHSGIALGSRFKPHASNVTTFEKDKRVKVSRNVIVSARDDQLSADAGPVFGHSLFTGLMMKGLITGQADTSHAGFITGTKLGAYTQYAVGSAPTSHQTPQFGTFDLDAGGELIIPLGNGAATSTPNNQPSPIIELSQLESSELARIRRNSQNYWLDDDPIKNFPAARSATLSLCAGGDGWACGQAAASFRLGLGGASDYQRAVDLAKRGCQAANAGDSCVILGILNETGGTNIPPDLPEAARAFQEACDKGRLRGCVNLGRLYDDSYDVSADIPRDFAQARSLYQRGCDGGDMAGCSGLGYLYDSGKGIDKNVVQAISLFRKACAGGFLGGCANLASKYARGDGLPKDMAQAATLLQRACDGGWLLGCKSLAVLYQIGDPGLRKDLALAATLFRKACDGGEMEGCVGLGILYATDVDTKDFAQASDLFRRACDANWLDGCINLAILLHGDEAGKHDFTQAAILYRKACDGGWLRGCVNLAMMYENGEGVETDASQAGVLYKKACDGGHVGACTYLGMNYASGLGVPKDPAKAVALFRKACDAGDQNACLFLNAQDWKVLPR
jgi:TPR repeat protein